MMLLGVSGFGDSSSCGVESCMELCGQGCPAGQTYSIAADACKPTCPAGQCYDVNGNCAANSAAGSSGSSPGSTATSWWQSALSALTAGAVNAFKSSTSPTSTMTMCSNGSVVAAGMPCPKPWYQTGAGIGGILLGLGVVTYLVVKK